jgi:hypothetical protein
MAGCDVRYQPQADLEHAVDVQSAAQASSPSGFTRQVKA